MKTKIKYYSLALFFFFTILIGSTIEIKAESHKTGKWVAVYNGGDKPVYWECVYAWYTSNCIVGDTRTSDPNAPIQE